MAINYLTAVESPPRFQFEENSGTLWASQTNNCGVACATKIACFYNNTWYSIETTRRLVMECCVPTTGYQQALMLQARGVPAEPVWIDSLTQLDQLLGDDGTRPIIIGVQMSRVPASVRDHPFLGWHAICLLSTVTLMDGTRGYWVMDPNFSPKGGHRPDPDNGVKFYSRSVLYYAYIQNSIRWAVVPNRRKQVFRNVRVEGDPADMGVRFVDETGKKLTVKANKPFRGGISVKSPVIKTFGSQHAMKLLGRVKREDMAEPDRQFGPCWVGTLFRNDGKSTLAYVMDVDTVDGSYRDA